MILILTNQLDFAVDYTILRLEERGIRFFRLNSEELTRHSYKFEVAGGGCRRLIRAADRVLDFDEVRSVWYRRKLLPTRNPEIATEFQPFAQGELLAYVEGLTVDPTLLWVNPLCETTLAERKLYQLRLAAAHGFNVPRTWATNDRDAVLAAQATGLPLVVKPVFHGLLAGETTHRAIYTRRLKRDEQLSRPDISVSPSLIQEEITRGRDLRVTVVGDRVFGAEVVWDSDANVDWRAPAAQPTFRQQPIGKALTESCLLLMRSLSLKYAAFDFIESADGTPYFLELNPAGEFAWLEVALGLPIRDALLDLLEGG